MAVARGPGRNPAPGVSEPTGMDRLREEFPGWHINSVWATACSGPDQRRYNRSAGPG
jgi:hypothetical protein